MVNTTKPIYNTFRTSKIYDTSKRNITKSLIVSILGFLNFLDTIISFSKNQPATAFQIRYSTCPMSLEECK